MPDIPSSKIKIAEAALEKYIVHLNNLLKNSECDNREELEEDLEIIKNCQKKIENKDYSFCGVDAQVMKTALSYFRKKEVNLDERDWIDTILGNDKWKEITPLEKK